MCCKIIKIMCIINMDKLIDSVKIISIKYLCGPNIWCDESCIEVLINIGEFENYPSNKIKNLYENIKNTLPTIINHRCSYGTYGGFLKRLEEGTYFGHILEHITLELQSYTGYKGGFGRTRETEISGIYKIVLSTQIECKDIIIECFYCSLELLFLLIKNEKINISTFMNRIIGLSSINSFCDSTNEIISTLPGTIPYFKLNESNFIQLGYGNKQKRIWITESCFTIGISDSISKNKYLTKKLLKNQGIEIPNGRITDNVDELYKIIDEIGYPIVIKPYNGNDQKNFPIIIKPCDRNNGKECSITINSTDNNLSNFFQLAQEYNKNYEKKVIIEEYLEGDLYRILIVNNNAIACCKYSNEIIINDIIGDGISTIFELIEHVKSYKLFEMHYEYLKEDYLKEDIVIEKDCFHKDNHIIKCLNKYNYSYDTILKNNQKIIIERKFKKFSNIDINYINKDIINKCKLASRIINLDICGIDIILKDISKPLTKDNGAILDLTSGPDISIHKNSKISVGKEIINYIFNNQLDGFIPIISIIGDGNQKFVNYFISSFFYNNEKYVGSYGKNGFYLNNKKIIKTTDYNWESVKHILMNNNVEIAIFDNDYSIILEEGLFYKSCNGIFLGNIKEDSLKILKTITYIIPKNGYAILNADDKNIEDLYESCNCNIIFYTNSNDNSNNLFNNKLLNNHILNGGKIVLNNNRTIVLHQNYKEIKLFNIDKNIFKNINIYDILASVAGIWSYSDLFNNSITEVFNKFI